MSFLPALTRRMCAWPLLRNSLLMIAISRQVSMTNGLRHDPEKWVPVFRKDHAQTKR
jgi:hypothetical protein